MSTSRTESSFYKHKYRELLKAIDDIKADISTLSHYQSNDGQDLVMIADVLECIDKYTKGEEQWE